MKVVIDKDGNIFAYSVSMTGQKVLEAVACYEDVE